MARPKLSAQTDLLQTIKATAWKQIAESGASSLSLRAIARALGITAPAIYNHYPSRDDLVTALIIEAFGEFGDSQLASGAGLPENDYAGRLRAAGLSYRQWAVDHPQRYLLIFGTPIPGYVAPAQLTQPSAGRSLAALINVLDAANHAGALRVERQVPFAPDLHRQLEIWRDMSQISDVSVLYTALVIWSRVHGLVMFEISHQYPPFLKDPGQIFIHEIESMVHQYMGPKLVETTVGVWRENG